MYHRPLKEGLVDQIYRQKILLEHIRTSLLIGPGEVHHVALLPDSFAKEVGKLPVPVLTWESVLDAYEGIGSPYFLEVLRLALRSYEDLKSKKSAAFGANKDANVTGVEIHDRYLDGTLEYEFMGRQGGLGGKLMTKDIQSASWKTHPYEVRHSPLDKPNWFPVADFVALIEGPSRPTS